MQRAGEVSVPSLFGISSFDEKPKTKAEGGCANWEGVVVVLGGRLKVTGQGKG